MGYQWEINRSILCAVLAYGLVVCSSAGIAFTPQEGMKNHVLFVPLFRRRHSYRFIVYRHTPNIWRQRNEKTKNGV